MFRKLMAGTAVVGALTLETVGLAGAATTAPSSGTGSRAATLCARMPKAEARIAKFESAVAARLPTAEVREAKAKSSGHTKLATAIANRIALVEKRERALNALLARAKAKCASVGSTGATGASGDTGLAGA